MSINEQIASLIAAAKAVGLKGQDLADEILVRWSDSVGGQVISIDIDEYGRHKVPGFNYWIFSPAPLLQAANLWANEATAYPAPMTELQIQNIRVNCGVGPDGEEQPAAGLGFSDGTNELPVSYLAGRRWTYEDVVHPAIPGKVSRHWKDNGPFAPKTFRTRFKTLGEATEYFANYTGS